MAIEIVDFPFKNVIFHSYVKLPEGKWIQREEVSPAMVRNSWLKMVMLKAFSHDFWSKEIQLALDLRKMSFF
jgi:hypothetical protein